MLLQHFLPVKDHDAYPSSFCKPLVFLVLGSEPGNVDTWQEAICVLKMLEEPSVSMCWQRWKRYT